MPSPFKQVFFEDFTFHIHESVYEPAEDSFLFADCLDLKRGEVVLDVGTGCGILGIISADKAKKVVATDLNPYAVRCARNNAKINGVANKILFMQGDLFRPVVQEELFDLILFNAPYLPSAPSESRSWLNRAWAGGIDGRQIIDRFICNASKYLRENGRILLMQSTLSDVDKTLHKFEKDKFKTNIIVDCALPFFEQIVLIKVER